METAIPPQHTEEEQPMNTENAAQEKTTRFRIAVFGFFLFVVFVVGLLWLATTPKQTVGLTLSFVAGLSMIFLPCTLPLAFVIVPLTMGKDPKKGLLMAFSFTLGITITLSLYGVFIAALGKTFGLKSDAEVYAVLLGGTAAFLFGLSELGLVNIKLPSYSGKFPDFIQRQKDYVKVFLLGLFLGNAGVGCPNPAFYLLLGYIATVGDLFNGWFLGFIHGLGRSVPLIFLAILGTLGVNALSGIAKHKNTVERAMGWMLVIIGAYLLTFGIFGHDWFIASGLHGTWERVISGIGGERFSEVVLQHEHKLVDVPNLVKYGNLFFLGLVALTMLIAFAVQRFPKRTLAWLAIVYAGIALLIGYSTAWTFQTDTNIHIQFHGVPADMQENETMHKTNEATMYHEEGGVTSGVAVNLNIAPIPVAAGVQTRLIFFVNEKPANRSLPVSSLDIEHEKPLHVIGVRNDMNNFFHIHPVRSSAIDSSLSNQKGEADLRFGASSNEKPLQTSNGVHPDASTQQPGVLSADHVFAKPGLYKIWSEIKYKDKNHIFGHQEISVTGEGAREEKFISFSRTAFAGNYQVILETDEPIIKNHEHELRFDIHAVAGEEVSLEPYLGELMHLVIIKDDLKRFIHAHPETEGKMMFRAKPRFMFISQVRAHGDEEDGHEKAVSNDETVDFRVVFPEAGLYKTFAQFRPRGANLPPDETITASFWIKIEEMAPTGNSILQWWMLLMVSLAAIAVLSFGVKKYLAIVDSHE